MKGEGNEREEREGDEKRGRENEVAEKKRSTW